MVYGVFYGDLLMLLRNQCRPYEKNIGDTEKLCEKWTAKLVEEMKDLDTLSYPEGHKRNPQQIQAAVGQFAVNVEAGKEFYCNIFNCDGIIFFVENPDVYVMYGGRRYDANEQGVIEFELSCKSANGYAQVMFGSDSEEPQNFVA